MLISKQYDTNALTVAHGLVRTLGSIVLTKDRAWSNIGYRKQALTGPRSAPHWLAQKAAQDRALSNIGGHKRALTGPSSEPLGLPFKQWRVETNAVAPAF